MLLLLPQFTDLFVHKLSDFVDSSDDNGNGSSDTTQVAANQ